MGNNKLRNNLVQLKLSKNVLFAYRIPTNYFLSIVKQ